VRLSVTHEPWPIAGAFTISRGAKTEANVVVVALDDGEHQGRGECVPYPRYGETVPQVMAALEAARPDIERGLPRAGIPALIKPRAARNALDCALWDLEAKRAGKPAWALAGLEAPLPLVTAYTLSLGTPEAMAAAASKAAHLPLLKLKLGRVGDEERLRMVRKAAPNARLIVDANEGWRPADLPGLLAVCADVGVELIEQPLPADDDEALLSLDRKVAICADESAQDADGLKQLLGKYDAVNIKLDKTGGLTPALAMAEQARARGLKIMVGCMLATSLAMAPAMLLAQYAAWIDLDGPLLLANDRVPGITFRRAEMQPAPPVLWG
jgi:L-alanine-DL-glutamate epimerase-like enolase superfamily enzyme